MKRDASHADQSDNAWFFDSTVSSAPCTGQRFVFLILIVTGAALYFTPLIALVGRRMLIEQVHSTWGSRSRCRLLLGLAATGDGPASRRQSLHPGPRRTCNGSADSSIPLGPPTEGLRPRLGKFNRDRS